MATLTGAPRSLAGLSNRVKIINKLLIYLALTAGAFIAIFPFYWMIATSLKQSSEIMKIPPTMWPSIFDFSHYEFILATVGLGWALLNSLVVASCRVLIVGLVALMTGYTLAKLSFPGRQLLFMVVLGLMMIPAQLFLIPLFLLMDKYNWIDTYWALVVPGAINSFSIFLMRQAFLSVPDDYIDAARIDGASHPLILFKIGLPMVMPMVLTLVLVNAFWSWNDFMWPFIVIVRDQMATLPVALARFARMAIGPTGGSTRYGEVMAAATLTALPIMIVFLILQRRFVESLTMTGLKG